MSTWKPIPGYEDYEVSDAGHIAWNSPKGRKMLRPGTNTSGHQTVGLYKDGRRTKRYIHELVLLAHVGERPKGYVACHRNDDPADNTLTNPALGHAPSQPHRRNQERTLRPATERVVIAPRASFYVV